MKNIYKYLSLVALILVGALSFTACGNDEDDPKDDPEKPVNPTKGNMYGSYFMEPCIQWGASLTTVRSFMDKYGFEEDPESEEYDDEDNSTMIVFYPNYKEDATGYLFEGKGNKGKLYGSMIFISSSNIKLATLRSLFTGKGYFELPIETDEDEDEMYFYLSADENTIAAIAVEYDEDENTTEYIAQWIDASYLLDEEAKSRSAISSNSIKKAFAKLRK